MYFQKKAHEMRIDVDILQIDILIDLSKYFCMDFYELSDSRPHSDTC